MDKPGRGGQGAREFPGVAEVSLPEPDYSPPPLPPGFPRWKHFAWNGWDVRIPVDWDLGALFHNEKGGYFRLDDEFEPRLMVRWQPLAGKFDPGKAIERHFKKELKARAKAGQEATPRIGAPLPGIKKAFKDLEYRTYELAGGAQRSVGLAAHCAECNRVFIVEMHCERGGAGERLIGRVLGSLRDHPGGKLARWEMFGLSADLPASLRAAGHRFNQGFVNLAAAEPGTRVELCRWTLADTHLAAVDLRTFLALHLANRRRRPFINIFGHAHLPDLGDPSTLMIEKAAVQSHPGCIFYSKERLAEAARGRLRRLFRMKSQVHRTGLIWHCAGSNRIFMLTISSGKQADVAGARLTASRVRCCKVIY